MIINELMNWYINKGIGIWGELLVVLIIIRNNTYSSKSINLYNYKNI